MSKSAILAFAVATTTALTGIGYAVAQSPAASIEQRQAAMKLNGASMKTLVPMARGEAPWNQAAAVQALENLQRVGQQTVSMFPRGSGTESGTKTAALPAMRGGRALGGAAEDAYGTWNGHWLAAVVPRYE